MKCNAETKVGQNNAKNYLKRGKEKENFLKGKFQTKRSAFTKYLKIQDFTTKMYH